MITLSSITALRVMKAGIHFFKGMVQSLMIFDQNRLIKIILLENTDIIYRVFNLNRTFFNF